jgi:hypothetical protein
LQYFDQAAKSNTSYGTIITPVYTKTALVFVALLNRYKQYNQCEKQACMGKLIKTLKKHGRFACRAQVNASK